MILKEHHHHHHLKLKHFLNLRTTHKHYKDTTKALQRHYKGTTKALQKNYINKHKSKSRSFRAECGSPAALIKHKQCLISGNEISCQYSNSLSCTGQPTRGGLEGSQWEQEGGHQALPPSSLDIMSTLELVTFFSPSSSSRAGRPPVTHQGLFSFR